MQAVPWIRIGDIRAAPLGRGCVLAHLWCSLIVDPGLLYLREKGRGNEGHPPIQHLSLGFAVARGV